MEQEADLLRCVLQGLVFYWVSHEFSTRVVASAKARGLSNGSANYCLIRSSRLGDRMSI